MRHFSAQQSSAVHFPRLLRPFDNLYRESVSESQRNDELISPRQVLCEHKPRLLILIDIDWNLHAERRGAYRGPHPCRKREMLHVDV